MTWSDYRVVLGGVIRNGVLEVRETPRLVTEEASAAVIRFSAASEPVTGGGPVSWAFDVRSTGEASLCLIFTGGQKVDVVLSRDGVEKYRWSEGKAFTVAMTEITLSPPGEAWTMVVDDTLDLPPGEYQLTATVRAKASPWRDVDEPGEPLPTLTTTITIH